MALVDRNFQLAQNSAKELSQVTAKKVLAYQCDVTDPISVKTMIDNYEKDFSIIDFAVNNAGIFTGDPALDISPEAFNR